MSIRQTLTATGVLLAATAVHACSAAGDSDTAHNSNRHTHTTSPATSTLLSPRLASAIIVLSAVVGFAFAMYWWYLLSHIEISPSKVHGLRNMYLTDEVMHQVYIIYSRISDGATAFLMAEYRYMAIFMAGFGAMLFILLGLSQSSPSSRPSVTALAGPVAHAAAAAAPWTHAALSLAAFLMGALTSVAAGWVGMRVAVYSNARTAVMATHTRPSASASAGDGGSSRLNGSSVAATAVGHVDYHTIPDSAAAAAAEEPVDHGMGFMHGFQTAFRGGITMGFALTSMGLLALFLTVQLLQLVFPAATDDDPSPTRALFECVAAFGLGGSAVACFGRVGGGIYTKAADVGADLVGKVEKNIPEDDARNPGVIADCIGDNVGDIAGMGSDLFGSYGESTCAAFVIATSSRELVASPTAMLFPLLITAVGLVGCMGVAYHGATRAAVRSARAIEPALKRQLLWATVAASVVLTPLTLLALPSHFTLEQNRVQSGAGAALLCVLVGLWSGLLIGYTTEYYTSNACAPVRQVAASCSTGAATNIIYGVALGYASVVAPSATLCAAIYMAYRLCGLYGFALAALGILSTMSVALTIDAYGPISDNAGGIAEMAHMGHAIREITDALDAAGNTTAAIGKGFAISSAGMVALALYGAFIARVEIPVVNVLDAHVLPGLFCGAMLPYWFSSLTMKSVGVAAMQMVNEIREQFRDPRVADGTSEPNYANCVAIATTAALEEMIAPAALVMLAPITMGVLFGKYALAGMLPGAIVSGVQMAISASNTGGAWDNAKKYIEQGGLGKGKGKGSSEHAAAVIGDTVGDPMKDTSGPALNILIKLMAIISVVFAPVFQSSMGGIVLRLVEH